MGLRAALAFFPALWWVQDDTSSLDCLYDEFLWAVHGFRMPVSQTFVRDWDLFSGVRSLLICERG